MTTRAVDSKFDLDRLVQFLKTRKRPYTVEITSGRRRSTLQNRLQRLLCNEIAEQLGDRTPEEVRGDCKLRFGVPILRAENELFCEKYDRLIKPLPYETKLEFMMEPIDLPVTRIMVTGQKQRYLDAIYRHYGAQGLVLTVPDPRAREAA